MSKLNPRESAAFHKNMALDGRTLDPAERAQFLEKYLPPAPISSGEPSPVRRYPTKLQRQPRSSTARSPDDNSSTSQVRRQRKKPVRTFVWGQLHVLIFSLIHFVYGIHIKLRRTYRALVGRLLSVLYYHHRTPELIQKDIKNLDRVPEHLSVVLQFKEDEGLEELVNDVSEISAWCASAKIPRLSVYEKSGILKSYLPQTHRAISRNLHAYFGSTNRPTISLRAPHMDTYSPPTTPLSPFPESDPFHLQVLVISQADGRETMVDLTKTLSEMSQHGKLDHKQITSKLVDAELREGVMDEPDLLILFGDRVKLEGYPPWQIRLTEIFHVQDNAEGVGYQVFLRALHRYAKAQMRFGR